MVPSQDLSGLPPLSTFRGGQGSAAYQSNMPGSDMLAPGSSGLAKPSSSASQTGDALGKALASVRIFICSLYHDRMHVDYLYCKELK